MVFFFLNAFGAHGQSNVSFSGVILSESYTPIVGAHVHFNRANTDKSFHTISDTTGKYFLHLSQGSYYVQITHLDIAPYHDTVVVYQEQDPYLVVVSSMHHTIDEVVIRGEKPAINTDTLTWDSSFLLTGPAYSILQTLEIAPGIEISNNQIKINGKVIRSMYINNIRYSDGDLILALKSLPSEMIQEIQFFDSKDNEQSFQNTMIEDETRSLNIVTKGSFRRKPFGKGSIGLGIKNRFLADLTSHYFGSKQNTSIHLASNNLNNPSPPNLRPGNNFSRINTNIQANSKLNTHLQVQYDHQYRNTLQNSTISIAGQETIIQSNVLSDTSKYAQFQFSNVLNYAVNKRNKIRVNLYTFGCVKKC